MRFSKAGGDLEKEFHHSPKGRLGPLVQKLAQAFAVHEFHGERVLPVGLLPQGVGEHDGRMVQLRQNLGLALETLHKGSLVVKARDHLLDDHHAVERFVVAEVDVAHGAMAQELRRLVYAYLIRQGILCLFFRRHC